MGNSLGSWELVEFAAVVVYVQGVVVPVQVDLCRCVIVSLIFEGFTIVKIKLAFSISVAVGVHFYTNWVFNTAKDRCAVFVEQYRDDVSTLDEESLLLIVEEDGVKLTGLGVFDFGIVIVPQRSLWQEVVNRLHLHLE